ncbi:fimbrillin family protein [Bacteroides sp. ET225]|uniref:fimbrillin family protein n=1 Tax=Bacteroides sp. ET225 TaxID=2972461 RepID=UPI0021ACA551|nr:fimbrillin family protein [Bacteroides sp. ET225]MCR8917903.1 fimbrillin family protein [Bacteroides sp. ET225]
MKLSNLFYLGAFSALVLTGCKSNDDNSEWMGSDGIVFTSQIEGVTSRVSGASWDENDEVGIFMTTAEEEYSNYKYLAKTDGSLVADGQVLKYPASGASSFIAYYPYTTSLSGKIYAVNVSDQSDPKKIDLLYSNNATGIQPNDQVVLRFQHKLSQIVLNIQKEGDLDINGMAIKVSGMNTTANFDLNDGTLTATDSKADFNMNVQTEGNTGTAEAIVIPAADLTGATLTFTLADGKNFAWTVDSPEADESFKAGTKYIYTATISNTNGQPAVEMGKATIEDWTEQAGGNINVDMGEGEDPQPGEEFVALDESFAAGPGSFSIENKNLPSELTYIWSNDDRYSCMKASAYLNNTNYATEGWLVSSEIDLTTATTATLSFEHAINHNKEGNMSDNHIVAVSVDNGSSWTPLSGVSYPESNSWTFISSGNVDLSAYAGQKIKLAFQYKSSSTSASTWEVKNVKIVANGNGGTVDPDPDPEPTPGESDLFISEYAEGAGLNKYLELYNPTDETIDLSNYTLAMKNYSGSSDYLKPSGEKKIVLSGSLAPKTTIVYKHSDAALEVPSAVELSDDVMNFNGNDPILLYKNDVIIDRLGDETTGEVFGVDVTLRRKTSVTGPSATYDPNQWEKLEKGDVSGFGSF